MLMLDEGFLSNDWPIVTTNPQGEEAPCPFIGPVSSTIFDSPKAIRTIAPFSKPQLEMASNDLNQESLSTGNFSVFISKAKSAGGGTHAQPSSSSSSSSSASSSSLITEAETSKKPTAFEGDEAEGGSRIDFSFAEDSNFSNLSLAVKLYTSSFPEKKNDLVAPIPPDSLSMLPPRPVTAFPVPFSSSFSNSHIAPDSNVRWLTAKKKKKREAPPETVDPSAEVRDLNSSSTSKNHVSANQPSEAVGKKVEVEKTTTNRDSSTAFLHAQDLTLLNCSDLTNVSLLLKQAASTIPHSLEGPGQSQGHRLEEQGLHRSLAQSPSGHIEDDGAEKRSSMQVADLPNAPVEGIYGRVMAAVLRP